MSRRFEGKVSLDHRQLARDRPRAGADARARGRRGRRQLSAERRARGAASCARSRLLGSRAIAVQANMENTEDIDRLFERVERDFGRLDHFVSNAAASSFKKIPDLKAHNLDRSFDLNVRAFVLGAQRAVKLMKDGGQNCRCCPATAAYAPTRPTPISARTKPPSRRGSATWPSSSRRTASTSTRSMAA